MESDKTNIATYRFSSSFKLWRVFTTKADRDLVAKNLFLTTSYIFAACHPSPEENLRTAAVLCNSLTAPLSRAFKEHCNPMLDGVLHPAAWLRAVNASRARLIRDHYSRIGKPEKAKKPYEDEVTYILEPIIWARTAIKRWPQLIETHMAISLQTPNLDELPLHELVDTLVTWVQEVEYACLTCLSYILAKPEQHITSLESGKSATLQADGTLREFLVKCLNDKGPINHEYCSKTGPKGSCQGTPRWGRRRLFPFPLPFQIELQSGAGLGRFGGSKIINMKLGHELLDDCFQAAKSDLTVTLMDKCDGTPTPGPEDFGPMVAEVPSQEGGSEYLECLIPPHKAMSSNEDTPMRSGASTKESSSTPVPERELEEEEETSEAMQEWTTTLGSLLKAYFVAAEIKLGQVGARKCFFHSVNLFKQNKGWEGDGAGGTF
jgi:hypothetical protein